MIEPKNLDAGCFSVDPAELRIAARTVRETIGEFSERPTLKYWLDSGEVGNAPLAEALSEFQRNSSDAVGVLRVDALELAERLTDTAAGYETTDSDLARALSEAVGRQ